MNFSKKFIPILFLTTLFTGCHTDDCGCYAVAYEIGAEHVFRSFKIKLDHDEFEEQFVLYYDELDHSNSWNYFEFTLFDETKFEYLVNSNQFTYSDNLNSKIEFNENGYYEFYGSRIFYISYKNASEEIKNVIRSKKCSITVSPGGTFYFKEYLHFDKPSQKA